MQATPPSYSATGKDGNRLRHSLQEINAFGHVRQADFVFMRCMSDTHRFKRFDKFETVLQEINGYVLIFSGNPEITMLNRHLFKGTDEQYASVAKYAASRGPDNDYGMLHYMAQQPPDLHNGRDPQAFPR